MVDLAIKRICSLWQWMELSSSSRVIWRRGIVGEIGSVGRRIAIGKSEWVHDPGLGSTCFNAFGTTTHSRATQLQHKMCMGTTFELILLNSNYVRNGPPWRHGFVWFLEECVIIIRGPTSSPPPSIFAYITFWASSLCMAAVTLLTNS